MKSRKCTPKPTDIVDLLGERDLRYALMQCGRDSGRMSHYELFDAFCDALPHFLGHRLQKKLRVLCSGLVCEPDFDKVSDRNTLWHVCAERLLLDPDFFSSFLKEEMLCRYEATPTEMLNTVYVCQRRHLSLQNGFVSVRADSWEAWSDLFEEHLSKSADACNGFLYRLPQCYTDRSPNPYAIGQILKQDQRGRAEFNLLHAQLLRRLFAYCREHDMPLFLIAPCSTAALISLLQRLKREVGLPALACSPSHPTDRRILDFTAENASVTLAVDAASAQSHEELASMLISIAEDYPAGRITLIP